MIGCRPGETIREISHRFGLWPYGRVRHRRQAAVPVWPRHHRLCRRRCRADAATRTRGRRRKGAVCAVRVQWQRGGQDRDAPSSRADISPKCTMAAKATAMQMTQTMHATSAAASCTQGGDDGACSNGAPAYALRAWPWPNGDRRRAAERDDGTGNGSDCGNAGSCRRERVGQRREYGQHRHQHGARAAPTTQPSSALPPPASSCTRPAVMFNRWQEN